MFVKPVKGRSVRCPVKGELLPESGQDVPNNVFWRTRLNQGDVVPGNPQKVKEQKA
ncbi:DUF2635 domain-containing protein [Morganella morganii]|uniref:DUF2635 domain-containing protein n=1 Tax=Morganella morganii TaxID=582 RepID=UPI000D1E9DD9|nr:DUF2635 domain-containing protein [Morganella morganii]QXO41620.1 DUF2635 domain-containing protein [Morganella morganii]QXO48832.1 DUF2635 domain-containing protein [Morganella morganii]QXO52695.1 DUF2635 domain-containing protein [Morganella morganii]QXO60436.1 DUF2635 domain-containing protein [Morganella morganii]QXO67965.1 DUF2635 domain-containing protein [Morganella morganii]